MITMTPLPSWKHIFQILFTRKYSQNDLAKPWNKKGDIAGWLSRSAWSLALISQWRKKTLNKSNCIIWVPDYFCNASLTPLRVSGSTLIFYPTNEEMIPDNDKCKELAHISPPDIFIIVHYFGKPSNSKTIYDFCKTHKAWLVEDAAHVLKPIKGVGTLGDFVIYSPHKHLPIPDGALLLACKSGPSKLGDKLISITGLPESWVSQLNELQKNAKKLVKGTDFQSLTWICKRILEKFKIKRINKVPTKFSESIDLAEYYSKIIGPNQSRISKKILSVVLNDLNVIARKRVRNQLLLDELLFSNYSISKTERPINREWIPYLSTYNLGSKEAENIYNKLNINLGLPVSTWPDLAPEVIKDNDRYTNAWSMRHKKICINIHQSISYSDLIKKFKRKSNDDKNELIININWENVTDLQWQKYIIKSERSNLLQSWEYGDTKSVKEGWTVKRGIFYKDKEPIAIIQLLQKKFFKTVVINRCNRGPLHLRLLTTQEIKAVYKEIAKWGNLHKKSILFFAPEIILSGYNIILMEQLGFKQFRNHPWESIWIDLSVELDILRKNLNGKWRNMLNFSEKSDLELIYGNDENLFMWLMKQYKTLMLQKNFKGMSVEFLSHFRKSRAGEDSQFKVFQASKDGEPIAGICVICHGNAATYLIGWNGIKGRTMKANQFLLWNAITKLKKSGIKHFDMGGINEDDVPGITAFKLGVNGYNYELVGEYIKW